MKTITTHVVVATTGEYEERSETMLRGYSTNERAAHAIWVHEEEDRRKAEVYEKYRELYSPLEQRLEYPMIKTKVDKPKQPHGVKKVNWPPEYWERLRAYEVALEEALEVYHAACEVYEKAQAEAKQVVLNLIGVTEEERAWFTNPTNYASWETPRYSIELLDIEIE